MKAVADNSALDYKDRALFNNTGSANKDVMDNSVMRMVKKVKIITKTKECTSVVKFIQSLKDSIIAFDGEGVNLGPSGPMTLLQFATLDEHVFLFDLLSPILSPTYRRWRIKKYFRIKGNFKGCTRLSK